MNRFATTFGQNDSPGFIRASSRSRSATLVNKRNRIESLRTSRDGGWVDPSWSWTTGTAWGSLKGFFVFLVWKFFRPDRFALILISDSSLCLDRTAARYG